MFQQNLQPFLPSTLGLASRITASVQMQVRLSHPPGASLVPCYLEIKSDPLIRPNGHSRAGLCHPPAPASQDPAVPPLAGLWGYPSPHTGASSPLHSPQDCSPPCPITASFPSEVTRVPPVIFSICCLISWHTAEDPTVPADWMNETHINPPPYLTVKKHP